MRSRLLAFGICYVFSFHVPVYAQSAGAQNERGEAQATAGDLLGARDSFRQAIALQPDFGRAYLNLGMVSLQLKDTSVAQANLDRAIQLLGKTPDAGYALYVRAKIFSEQNQPAKAAAALTQAVARAPVLAEAWSDLGQARKQIGDDHGALQAFQKAVALNPQDEVAQYRLGAEYSRQNNLPKAVEYLERAYQLNPKDQSVLNSLQAALRQQGNTAEANKVKQELAQLLEDRDRTNQNALAAIKLNNEAATLEKSGDLHAAAAKYGKALKLDPTHIGIRLNYAVALLRLGQWTQGLTELHEASLRDPANPQIKAALNDALAQAPPALVPKW